MTTSIRPIYTLGRHRPRRWIAILVAVCLAIATDIAAQVFRQRVEIVVVDASVVRNGGEPVLGLRAGDFEILVDDQPRKIVAFRLTGTHTSQTTARSPQQPSTSEPAFAERLVVLLVDRAEIRPRDGRAFLEAGAQFIDRLDPRNQLAVWAIPAPGRTFRSTHERVPMKEALLGMTGTSAPTDRLIRVTPEEAVAIVTMNDKEVLMAVVQRECGRFANAGPSCNMEIADEARRRYQQIAAGTRFTLANLAELVSTVAAFDGAKHIGFITPGPQLTPDNIDALERVSAAAAAARVHIHALQIPNQNELAQAGSRDSFMPASKQHLSVAYSLAAMTGGIALTPSDPRVAYERLVNEMIASYELGFEATASDRDGKPHRITVRVRGRQDVSVRARQQVVLRSEPTTTSSAAATAAASRPESPHNERDSTERGTPQPAASPAPEPPPTKTTGRVVSPTLLAAVGEYIERFEREFSSAVVEERYIQLIRRKRGDFLNGGDPALEWQEGSNAHSRPVSISSRRQLLADVALVHTPQGWIGYRDVATVDGRAVRDRSERVSKLFLSTAVNRSDQLNKIAAESARFNLGAFRRTLNIPTVPLSFLRSRNHPRFRFTMEPDDRLDGRAAHVIRYEETRRPTLVANLAGSDVPISGRMWIDSESGAVLQTAIDVSASGRPGELITRYRAEPGFEVLVPDFMWEWYQNGRLRPGNLLTAAQFDSLGESVECLARYSRYRRFTVSTKVK